MTDSGRSWAPRGITIKMLRLLINIDWAFPNAEVDIPTAAVALACPINTVHQAICRLRDQGLPIETIPPGPWNQWTGGATHYRLPPDALDQAHLLLHSLLQEQTLLSDFFKEPTNAT